jgi:hypothetical protein
MQREQPSSEEVGADASAEGAALLCRWCRRPVVQVGRGRPRVFCKRSCRQRDFEARNEARLHGLDEEQIIVTREALNDLQDTIYVLQCAIDDIDRDFPKGFRNANGSDLVDSLGWLLQAARPVAGHSSIR